MYNILGGEDWLLCKNTRITKATCNGFGSGWKIAVIENESMYNQ